MLIASQPTRGLDVGSIEFVHKRIVGQRDRGVAVVIISSELDEIYALADRIAVMYEGKITGFRDPGVPAAELGRLMAFSAPGNAIAQAWDVFDATIFLYITYVLLAGVAGLVGLVGKVRGPRAEGVPYVKS